MDNSKMKVLENRLEYEYSYSKAKKLYAEYTRRINNADWDSVEFWSDKLNILVQMYSALEYEQGQYVVDPAYYE